MGKLIKWAVRSLGMVKKPYIMASSINGFLFCMWVKKTFFLYDRPTLNSCSV